MKDFSEDFLSDCVQKQVADVLVNLTYTTGTNSNYPASTLTFPFRGSEDLDSESAVRRLLFQMTDEIIIFASSILTRYSAVLH